MELELNRTHLAGYNTVLDTTVFQEETLETIVPDACPDILRLVDTEVKIILKSKEAMDKIHSLTRFAYNAPMVLLFCADLSKAWKSSAEPGYNTGEMDVSIVCTHMMLEAWELGIGSVWVRGFDARQVAKAFDLPEHIKPICLLPIGYPSKDSVPYTEWHSSYRPLSETVEER